MTETHDTARRGERVREGLKEAETGKPSGAKIVDRINTADPATTQAVEQEEADGPGKRGLSR